MRAWLSTTIALATLVTVSTGLAADAPPEPKVTYDDHVKAIFRAKCANCHNTDKKTAGLDLTNYTSMMQGGGSGAAVEPGDSSVSYLWMVVNHETEPYMPPNSPKIDEASLAVIKEWIDLGAPENKGSKVAKKKTMDLTLSGVPTGKPEGPPPMPPRLPLEPLQYTTRADAVSAIASSPWAPLVAVGGFHQVLLYNSQSLELVGVLPFPEGVPRILRFSRNGKLLLAGGGRGAYQGLCVIWDVTTGQRITTIGDETDSVLAADISPDQKMVALGGPNKKVKVYSTQTGEMLYEIEKHTEWVYALEFSPDNVLLATADRNGGLYVWEALTGSEFHVLDGHKTAVNSVSWRSDSNLLASCDDEGQIRLWEMENGKSVRNWAAHGGGAKAVEFSRDGRLVSCGVDKTAKLWGIDGKQQRAFPAFGDIALDVTYAAEGDRVVAGDWLGEVRVWNAADGTQVGVLAANPPTLQMRIDGAVASTTATKQKLDAATAAQTASDAAVKAAAAATAKLKTDMAAAETARKAADEKVKALTAQMAQLKVDQAKATESAKQLETVVTTLAAGQAQVQTAAKADDNAADLTAATAALEKARADRATEIAALKAAAENAGKQLAAATKELETAAAAVTAGTQMIANLQKQLPALEKDLKAKQEQFAAAQKAMTEAQAGHAAAEAAIQRWRDELAFATQADKTQADKTQADKTQAAASN
ncbi:MAG: c-type cytochrome domain-containing protein [Planctomycetaceae bacterium]